MEIQLDFLNWLDPDMSIKILMCLEDPSDIVRASCVSRQWRNFVIMNGLSKQLCLRMFPQLTRVDHVIESSCNMKKPVDVGSSKSMEWETSLREHRVYSFLARGFTSFAVRDCNRKGICASSTDNYPAESIHNTLEPRDRIDRRASYWSSKGQSNPQVPETLVYKLTGDLCAITEINIQPFQAYFQPGLPIYSAKSVRFQLGHKKSPVDPADDKFVWTYTSQEFPMAQENRLQTFKLPEPLLCIGGFLRIELLGRVQRQEMDGLFYICVSHVQVMGRSLSPAFNVEILEPSEGFVLKALSYTQTSLPEDEPRAIFNPYLERRATDLEIVNLLRVGAAVLEEIVAGEVDDEVEGDDDDDAVYEDDDEFDGEFDYI
ncbi:F-box-like domain-containing protein [Cephalotus follicularis]|uniref:F-box-like domain-containing protein n=1 Tax=Cephalotus follicularis TaxID=3775 RepID=A0A1Q3CZC9_CEPFO|nr:F-box-like domain-containing protein [Cephalotus follicularis]